jgi:mannose-6-phosphate isomerase-like protein (cupin superfamily)
LIQDRSSVRLSTSQLNRSAAALLYDRFVGFSYGSVDELGPGVFRKVRRALGVHAFGANAMVLPEGTGWFEHYHDDQDELYFVHRGRAVFEIEGERFELEPGGLCHVESTTPRRFWNSGEGDLVLLIVGAKGGYVGRDGHMVDPEDEERRRSFSAGDEAVIRRLPE